MKERITPKIFCKEIIKRNKEDVGRINLVKYLVSGLPHIEFEIFEGFRGRGIMSEELPKYLKKYAPYHRMLAIVKKDNEASIKILEKNRFIKFATQDTTLTYILAVDLIDRIGEFQKEVLKNIRFKKG